MTTRPLLVSAASALTASAAFGAGELVTSQPYLSGFIRPLEMVQHPTDPSVQFVVEQNGTIRVIQNGAVLPTLLLNVAADLGSTSSTRGLLGLAFPPDYPATPEIYIYHSNPATDSVFARFTHMPGNPLVADPSSRDNFYVIDQPNTNTEHFGGTIKFGPDGYFYISLGDGGGQTDPFNNGQNMNTVQGSLLRIDVSGGFGSGYSVPADNPFVGVAGADEIWCFGFRNPWKFSFDLGSCGTGDIFVADVGQFTREELDYIPAGVSGLNFGWKCREGAVPFSGCSAPPGFPFVEPILDYPASTGRSITGGYVYRGAAMPFNRGRYFYADHTNGRVWSVDVTGGVASDNILQFDAPFLIPSLGRDAVGELYVLDYNGGRVLRLVAVNPLTPGDINRDGAVSGADLALLLGEWSSPACGPADIDNNGIVQGSDLAILLGNWSSP